jgi:ABC-type nitrate/sulfonate/bicarbonate transport system ATPase subunit
MNTAALSIINLSISRGGKSLYNCFSLEADAEKVTCLIAPSGSGKTTLLDYIGGILDKSADVQGKVLFEGKEVRPAVSFLFQEPRLIPSADVIQNVMFPLLNCMDKNKAETRARLFLDRVQLSAKCSSFPRELSGGERQRVSMARCFSYPSKLLLMDEPFQSQDMRIKLRLIETLQQLLLSENRTVLFVTHDVREAVLLSDRILVMDGNPLHMVLDERNSRKGDDDLEKRISAVVSGSVSASEDIRF